MKTAEEIREQIAALEKRAEELEKREREEIGAQVQRKTGKKTWKEIEPILFPANVQS